MKKDSVASARILLADDNRHGLLARATILRDLGHVVETAASGEEAWAVFQKSDFDLLVTDYKMGDMDGLELIRLIRASQSPARIVLLSGFVSGLGMTCETTGADEVISKGSKEVPELLRAVARLIQQPPRRGAGSVRRSASRKIAR